MSANSTKYLHRFHTDFDQRSISYVACSLLALFVAIYSLCYSGTFVTDDEHLLASRTLSLAFDQNLNDNRVYGNSRHFALSNLSPEYAANATNIEPAEPFLGSIIVLITSQLPVGRVQTLFLLNIWVTAIAVVVVFWAVLIHGYSKTCALVVALLFGLGTQVWPYALTYFRDSLAMLFLLLAWTCATIIIKNPAHFLFQRAKWLAWIGLFVFFALGILAKNTVVIAAPVLLLDIVINSDRNRFDFQFPPKTISKKGGVIFLFFFIALLLGLFIWIVIFPHINILARFTPGYYLSLIIFFFTTPHPKLLEALSGPFISPGKSIFLFSPVLVLALIGLVRHPKTAWPAWLYLILLVTGQALYYDDDWWGHINWGLRFILPAIPPLVISIAPVVADWYHFTSGRMALTGIGIISALVQIVGILPQKTDYYVDLYAASPAVTDFEALWIPKYSALAWHVKSLLTGGTLELAASRVGATSIPIVLGFFLVILLIFIGLSGVFRPWLPLATLLLTTALVVFMLLSFGKDPSYYRSRIDLDAAHSTIARQYLPNDLILIKSYGTPVWYFWMNWANPRLPWTSLPFYFPKPDLLLKAKMTHNPEIALDAITLSILGKVPDSFCRIWIVIPSDSPGADLNLEVDWLRKNSISNMLWNFRGENTDTRLYLFETARNQSSCK